MHAATPALVIAALINACVWPALLWQLWVLRHSFEIAARAPVLVAICGVGSLTLLLAVFVHWILLLESKGLPCYVMLSTSYLCIAIHSFPYCLRGIQLVVAYNTHYRLKYARYMKGKHILTMSVVSGIIMAVAAGLIVYNTPESYARNNYGCYFFQEKRLVGATLILISGPMIFAMFELMKVHDVFGIRTEIFCVIIPTLISGVFQITFQELLQANVIEDSRTVHFWMEMDVFVFVFNSLVWSALIPVSRYHGWHGTGKMYIVPLEEKISLSVEGKDGVYEFAQEGGEVAEAFGDFCRKNLCMENWEFIIDTVDYMKLTNPDEQFTCFIRIVDRYLRRTSPQEVNVGSEMQDRLLPFQTITAFTGLDEIRRRTIFEAPVGEVVRMLEQNILAKFKLTRAMQRHERRRTVGIEISTAQEAAEGDRSMMAMMTSISLGKIGSPTRQSSTGRPRTSMSTRRTSVSQELSLNMSIAEIIL